MARLRQNIACYHGGRMSKAAELLDAFEALPADEKRSFAVEVLRRSLPFDSGELEDAEIARAADQLMAALDREEDAAGTR